MIEIRQTEIFARWLANMRDGRARARINARIRRLSLGNPGDTKSVGGGVSEIRSTTVPATAFISSVEAKRLRSCSRVETSEHKIKISRWPSNLHATFRSTA